MQTLLASDAFKEEAYKLYALIEAATHQRKAQADANHRPNTIIIEDVTNFQRLVLEQHGLVPSK